MLWLVNERGELLLARRADHIKKDPGLWGPSVTGKVEADETYEQAAIREAEEELGLRTESYQPQFLFATDFDHPDGELRKFEVYIAKVDSDIIASLKIDSSEVAEVKWIQLGEMRTLLESKSGTMVVASAFVLWEQIFKHLAQSEFVDL